MNLDPKPRMGYCLRPMLESVFQRKAKEKYEKEGCIVLKLDPDGVTIPKGFPDLIVITPYGTSMFLETKSESGVVKPAQKYWHDKLRAMGHEVQVPRPEAT